MHGTTDQVSPIRAADRTNVHLNQATLGRPTTRSKETWLPLGTLVQIAADLGMTMIRADTDLDNVVSQRTLEHAGFYQVEADSKLYHYEAPIGKVWT